MTLLTRHEITEDDKQYIEEFKSNPVGLHSDGLMRVLNKMRGEDIAGKYVVVCTKPFEEWRLAEMQGRGKPLKYHDVTFNNMNDAEWEIFKRRWERHTGEKLSD